MCLAMVLDIFAFFGWGESTDSTADLFQGHNKRAMPHLLCLSNSEKGLPLFKLSEKKSL